MLSTKFAAGAAAAALTVFGGLTAASATNADVAAATGHVLPFAASSARPDSTADKPAPPPPASATHPTETTETTETTEKPDTTEAPKPAAQPSNASSCPAGEAHGDAVSAAAKSDSASGEAHGDAVSSVANCNGTDHASTNGDATAEQSSDTPDTTEANRPATHPGDDHADANAPTQGVGSDTPGSTHH